MEIILTASTIVNGKQKEEGWQGEVSFSEGRTLVSMGKATEVKEDEEVEVSLVVDVENSEQFKKMQEDVAYYKEEIEELRSSYASLFESLSTCTNIQCVKDLLTAELVKSEKQNES